MKRISLKLSLPGQGLRRWQGILLLADALGLFGVAGQIFHVSSGSARAVLFGLSAASLLLVALTLAGAAGLLLLAQRAWRTRQAGELQLPAQWLWLWAGLFLAGWLVAWTPAARFGMGYYYAQRLLPLAGWLAFASGTAALFVLAAQPGVRTARWLALLQAWRPVWLAAGLAGLVCLVMAGLAARWILGVTPQQEDYWYGAGVPVLAWQGLAALAAGLISAWVEKLYLHGATGDRRAALFDAAVFVALWIITGALWARIPVAANFMVSAPYPPNFAYYPAADGQNYDLASQAALLGQGLFNRGQMYTYFERPLYVAFLLYLHLLAGQDYELLFALQAGVLAVLPALAYLIGKALHSRGAGAGLAVLLAMRGLNGLNAGALLENSNPKMIMTDFPTAVGLALILWLAIGWAQNPRAGWLKAGWLCGCIGLWGLVRPHLVFLLPAVAILALALYFRDRRRLAAVAGLMLAAYLAAVLPWMQGSGSSISLFGLYSVRVERIISERYPTPVPVQPVETIIPVTGPLQAPAVRAAEPVTVFVIRHFLNNLAQSVLALPTTLRNEDLAALIKTSGSYWKPYWQGELTRPARFLLPINLALISLGLGAAWQRYRAIGLFPLFGLLFYNLVNSLARTSGGRYLVPADWIVILYYALGLAALCELAALGFLSASAPPRSPADPPSPARWRALVVLALLGGLGGLIPLAGSLHPLYFEALDKSQVAARLEAATPLPIAAPELRSFLEQSGAVALEGRALYPRLIGREVNALIPGALLQVKPYAHLSFMLLGRPGAFAVLLPVSGGELDFPHASDVLVLGCQTGEQVEAWAVFVESSRTLLLRHPSARLACPLPEPVCDGNGACR